MARFVSSVTSNVQGMLSPTPLARLTLLVGPNGAGKTSIVRALRLATENSAEDIAGRSVVRDHSELFQLAPAGATELYAAVTLQDGDQVLGDLGWSIRRDGEKVSKTPTCRWTGEGPGPRVHWPLTVVREAIAGNADTARKAWLRAVEGLTAADVRRKLAASVQEDWDRLAGEVEGSSGVEVLLTVSAQAAQAAREATKEASFYAKQAQTAKQGLAPEPTDAHIAHLEAAAKRAAAPASAPRFTRAQLQGALEAAQQAQQALYDEATAALAHYTEAASILEEWYVWGAQQLPGAYCFDTGSRTEEGGIVWATAAESFAIGTEPQPPLVASEEDRLLLAISDLATYQIQTLQQDATCSLCGTELTPEHWHHRLGVVGQILAESEEGRQAAVVAYETALAEWQERKQAFDTFHRELAEAKRVVEEALEAYNATVDQYEAKGQLVTATQAELETAPETIPTDTSSAELIAAVALRENWRQVRTLEAKAAEAERHVQRWEALVNACKTAQAEVMAGGIASFEAKVSKYLPEGWSFKLHPQTMRPGLIRPGRGELPLTALSGGEWAAVTIAMAAAMADPNADLVLLVPEDRAWDPVTLAAVMRGLSKAPGQVILTSTVEPRGKTPAGWTVVQVGEASAEPKAEPKAKPPKAPPPVEAASAEPEPEPAPKPKPMPTRRVVDNPSGKAPPEPRASSAPVGPRHDWTETEREDFWALGYDERQIVRLKEEAGRKILAENLAAEDVSVLPSGDFVRVVPGGQ